MPKKVLNLTSDLISCCLSRESWVLNTCLQYWTDHRIEVWTGNCDVDLLISLCDELLINFEQNFILGLDLETKDNLAKG